MRRRLAGCSGAGASSTFAVSPPGGIGIACPALAINGPALLSPAPGSTGGR